MFLSFQLGRGWGGYISISVVRWACVMSEGEGERGGIGEEEDNARI